MNMLPHLTCLKSVKVKFDLLKVSKVTIVKMTKVACPKLVKLIAVILLVFYCFPCLKSAIGLTDLTKTFGF